MTTPQPDGYGAPATDAALVVYGVHGRSQSPEFIRELADRVGDLERIRWIIPAAPGNTWYPNGFLADPAANQPALGTSLQTVDEQLADVLAGTDLPVVALGFSQGACLLAEHLLTKRPQVAGIILHTGGYLGPEPRSFAGQPQFPGTPAVVLTAEEDEWVPLQRTRETVEALTSAGAATTLTVYDDPEHHINDDAVDRIRELLSTLSPVPGTS